MYFALIRVKKQGLNVKKKQGVFMVVRNQNRSCQSVMSDTGLMMGWVPLKSDIPEGTPGHHFVFHRDI